MSDDPAPAPRHDPATPVDPPTTGYVLKMYPRFSETFIVTEILAREAAGERVVIFSLRPPADPRFHAELARVEAPVVYVSRPSKPLPLWEALREALATPGLAVASHLDELLAAAPDDAAQALAVAVAAREHGVDHLHAHFASISTTVARLASLVSGLPYSFTAHAKDIFHESVDDADLERKLRDAHHAVTVSDFNLRHLRERFGPAAARLHRVYNGLELDRFTCTPRPPRDGPVRVVAIGRLVEKKGFGLLLEAAARLHAAGTSLEVDLVGGGPLETELAAAVQQLGLDDVVTLHGPLPQAEVSQVLRAADVFVAPCVVGADGNADGLPTVLLEAMACGVPCIASDVTGIPEVVRDGETGLLVRSGDVDQLEQALARAADPRFDPAPLTVAARRLIEVEFDSRRLAQDLARLAATPRTDRADQERGAA